MENSYEEMMFLGVMYRRMGCFPAILLCVVLSLFGCKTIKESEVTEVHDTLTVHRIDTIKEYKLKTLFDTVHHWHSEVVTLSESGDTVKHVINNYFKERIIEKDSTDKYRSVIDSLKAVLNQLHEKEKEIVKEDWWSVWKWKIITLALLIALILATLPYIKKIVSRVIKQP